MFVSVMIKIARTSSCIKNVTKQLYFLKQRLYVKTSISKNAFY